MSQTKFILSIDGGGIRGVIAATILANLERDLKRPLYDTFDFYAGSSVGSWLALAISALKLPADEMVTLFNDDNVKQIFSKKFLGSFSLVSGPKYKADGKRKILETLFQTKRFRDLEKHTLITAYDVVANKAVIFKSQAESSDTAYNPTVAEVADASSAAPTYFPSVESTSTPPRWLIDGGVAANDPALCILTEALRAGIALENIKLLSLGTGITDHVTGDPAAYGKASQTWSQIGWLRHGIIDDLFSGDTTVSEYQAQQLLNDRYYRMNEVIPAEQGLMDNIDPQNIAALKQIGQQWYDQHRKNLLAWLAIN